MKVHGSGLWLACPEVTPRLSSAMAGTLGFLGFGSLDYPPGNLNDFLCMVQTRISFSQCFHRWFVRVHLVHCPLAFHLWTILWSIAMCASAQTRSIMLCHGPAFPLSTLSSFLFPRYTLFSLAVYFGFLRCLCCCWLVRFPFPT